MEMKWECESGTMALREKMGSEIKLNVRGGKYGGVVINGFTIIHF